MGLSSKKTTQSGTTNQNTSMNTTPTNPAWVTGGTEALGGRINDFFKNLDPASLVAGPDPLQQQAARGAASLGQFPSYGGGRSYSPSMFREQVNPRQGAGPSSFGGGVNDGSRSPSSGDPYGDAMSTFNDLRGSQANTYNPTLGTAQTYDARTGDAKTYNAAQLGPAGQSQGATIDPTQNVQSASLLDNLQSYMNPYTNDVVNTSLADYDAGAGRTRAQQALDLAGSPFAGSRAGVAQSLTEGELARGRGTLSAGLRADAFNTGAGLSNLDASRRQDASGQNAAAFNNRAIQQAGLTQGNNQFNVGEGNRFSLQQGMFNQQANSENTGAQNQYGLANLAAQNTAARDNMQAGNTFGLANMGAANDAGQFNAGQSDKALERQAAGAAGLVNSANSQQANSRANLTSQMDIGSILQQLAQQKAGSPLAALAAQTGLWGQLPTDLFKGSNSTGTMNGTSTGTTKESGASMGDWLKLMNTLAQAAASGGGGGGGGGGG